MLDRIIYLGNFSDIQCNLRKLKSSMYEIYLIDLIRFNGVQKLILSDCYMTQFSLFHVDMAVSSWFLSYINLSGGFMGTWYFGRCSFVGVGLWGAFWIS